MPVSAMTADLTAGTIAGVALVTTGYPFDTIKVLMQTNPGAYTGFGDALKQTWAEGGVPRFFKGLASPLVAIAAAQAMQFASFGAARSWVARPDGTMSTGGAMAAGAYSGVWITLIEGPQDLFKTQRQVQGAASSGPNYASTLDCARSIVRQYGWRGATQGVGATLLRNVPAGTVYFGTYETVREALRPQGTRLEDLSPLVSLTAGSAAGFMYWAGTYPLDVIKSAVQGDHPDPARRKYRGILHCARTLWAEGGARRFTAGLTPAILRSIPSNGVCFTVYQWTRDHIPTEIGADTE